MSSQACLRHHGTRGADYGIGTQPGTGLTARRPVGLAEFPSHILVIRTTSTLRGLRHTQSSVCYRLTSLLTKQAKRPCLLCHHHLARQVLQGQYLVKYKGIRSLIVAGADRGHCPYHSVLSQPEGRGWKPRGQHTVLWSLP